VHSMEVELLGGQAGLSGETTAVEWFPVDQAVDMELFHGHAEHIRDALAGRAEAFLR
jgi:hypothetical protein